MVTATQSTVQNGHALVAMQEYNILSYLSVPKLMAFETNMTTANMVRVTTMTVAIMLTQCNEQPAPKDKCFPPRHTQPFQVKTQLQKTQETG